MIGINDLHDISAAFTRIRSDIEYEKNIAILQSMTEVLAINDAYETNQIRNAIAKLPDLDREKWRYVFHQNLYVYDAILKDPALINLLLSACNGLISALHSKNFELAYDLTDAIHCLPSIIAENKFVVPKSYWKTHIQVYRNKWDKNFLIAEQKALA